MPHPSSNSWSLEVVRGKDAGKRYALVGKSVVLGNAVGAGQGIDLADQEGNAPRKMAARQASIESAGGAFVLRDLESPGGTFVNRQRVLAGQARPLQVGDVIQLGGVQLKVVNGEAASKPRPTTVPVTTPFSITVKGTTCRSWDDVLAVSAQRWADLRDELTSGRLGGALAAIGRGEFAPDAMESGSPDERLDAWLGRLPTTKPAAPELDVHPKRLVLKAIPGGGVLFPKVRVDNTGYRLLRFTVRVEPAGTSWLKPAAEFAKGTKSTAEGMEITLEATIPETTSKGMSASLVVESNGGSQSIPIALEPASARGSEVPETRSAAAPAASIGLGEWLGGLSTAKRLVGGAVAGSCVRLLMALATGLAATFGIGVSGGSPSLAASGLAMAAAGAFVGGSYAIKKKAWNDLFYAAIAGALGGLIAAAVAVAATRSVESTGAILVNAHAAAKVLLWGLIGVGIAAASTILVPPRAKPGRTS